MSHLCTYVLAKQVLLAHRQEVVLAHRLEHVFCTSGDQSVQFKQDLDHFVLLFSQKNFYFLTVD